MGPERTLPRAALAMRVRSPGTRTRLSIALALVALAAAVAAALVPAEPERATFSWPPPQVPSAQPARSWLAPLMLNRRTAASIHVRLPCRPGPMLPGAGSPAIVLATAREVRGRRALEISRPRGQNELRVRVGGAELGRFVAPPSGPCTLDVRIGGRRWTIRQSGGGASVAGELAARVGVNGLISQLDLRRAAGVGVEITPTAEDTRPSPSQTALRLLAVLFLVLALSSLLGGVRRRPARLALRRLLPSPSYPDAFVVLTLVTWWIVGPINYDDGWAMTRQSNSLHSGGFSNYFDNDAANLPFGTWFEWLQHFVVAHTNALVIQRIPSVACLAALWLVCRAILSRLVGLPPRRGDATWWSAAAVFSVGAAAFGVTLRPEPMNALLVAGVLLCAVRFAARPAIAPLAAAVLLAGLALTEHPEGVVALAPLLVCVPRIAREVRRSTRVTPSGAVAVLVCGIAWTVLLAFLDSDLRHRVADARLFRESQAHSGGVTDEWLRYKFLSEESALRRELVAVCVVCVVSLLAQGLRRRRLEERLPAASIGVGLPLLAFVPSKWVFHFGVLIGLCAVAAGVEVARLVKAGSSRRRLPVTTALAAFLIIVLATGWAASSRTPTGPLDLRTIRQAYLAAGVIPYFLWVPLVLLGVLGAAALHGRGVAARLSWQAATHSLPFMLVPLLALTALVFAVDALATPGWTYARQSVAVLAGRSTCGRADDLVIPDSRSMVPVPRMGSSPARRVARGAPSAPVSGVDVLAGAPARSGSPLGSPWYRLGGGRWALGLYVGGTARRSESLSVVWGRVMGGHVVPKGVGKVELRNAASRGREPAAWRFVGQSSLPARPPSADALGLRLMGASGRAPRLFVTGPISYSDVRLREHIERASMLTHISPYLLESIPCARLPAVELGAAERPNLLIDSDTGPSMTDRTGPFGAIPDLFQLRRLPLADSEHPPRRIWVYEVAVDTRDALLPAARAET